MYLSNRKISFYYRSQKQYEVANTFAKQMADDITAASGGNARFMDRPVSVRSPQWVIEQVRMKIPKEKLGKKRYLGIITIPERHMIHLQYNVEDKLAELGLELVSKEPNKPQYSEEQLVRTTVYIKTVIQFRKITSILNKKYGHGNWHFRNCKKILQKLRRMEVASTQNPFNVRTQPLRLPVADELKNGLKVDVIVVNSTDNAENLARYLFQAQLMS